MRRLMLLLGVVLILSTAAAAQDNAVRFALPAPAAAPASPQGGGSGLTNWQMAIGYQFSRLYPLGTGTNTNGLDLSFVRFLNSRFGLEANVSAGFGDTGKTTVPNNLAVKPVFVGGGIHVSFVRDHRLEPWVHGLIGLEHFRYSQTATFGSQNSLAFVVGPGIDLNFNPRVAFRAQADYLGTNVANARQGNVQFLAGFVFNF